MTLWKVELISWQAFLYMIPSVDISVYTLLELLGVLQRLVVF